MNGVERRFWTFALGATVLALGACVGSPPPFELGSVAMPFAGAAPSGRSGAMPAVVESASDTARPAAPAAPSSRRHQGSVGGAWIPWATLELNERPKTQGTPPGSVEPGDGFAARAGFMQDGFGTDVVFATTKHDESNSSAELTMYQLYVDFVQGQELWHGPVSGWIGGGVGVGMVRFDWDSLYKTENTALWQAEGIFALRLGRHISLEARAMGFLGAYPGRTAGVGALAMLGGAVTF